MRHSLIYLPSDFVEIKAAKHRQGILGHELSHIIRFDAAVNLLQIFIQVIFWFHPFVWWANKKIRAEREKCCDEMVIAWLGTKAKDFSTAIVNILTTQHKSTRSIPSLAIAGPVKNIEDRIKTIINPSKKFYKHPGIPAAIIILLLGILTVPTSFALTSRQANTAEMHNVVGDSQEDMEIIETVQDFVGAANIGDFNAVQELTYPNSTITKQLPQFQELQGFNNISFDEQPRRLSQNRAIVLSSTVNGDPGNYGKLLFHMRKKEEIWLVNNISTQGFRLKMSAEVQKQCEKSMFKLRQLGLIVHAYANDHQGNLPTSLWRLREYCQDRGQFMWFDNYIEYVGKGKNTNGINSAKNAIAYDRNLINQSYNTPILFLDGHVEVGLPKKIEIEAGLRAEATDKPEIQIESRFLYVPTNAGKINDFLEKEKIAHPSDEPDPNYTSLLDDEQLGQFLKLASSVNGAEFLATPRINVLDGEDAFITFQTTEAYISGWIEPNSQGQEPEPNIEHLNTGIFLMVMPTLGNNNEDIELYVEFEFSDLIRFNELIYKEHIYEEKYHYRIPEEQIVSTHARVSLPVGRAILFGGLKPIQKENEDGQKMDVNLFVLIKAEVDTSEDKEK